MLENFKRFDRRFQKINVLFVKKPENPKTHENLFRE